MTTTATRRANWPDYAGLVGWQKARSTGTFVGTYDGGPAGMDTAGGRWQTVCEKHSNIISHRTLELARAHAPHPDDWCDRCSGAEPEDD